jgi:hypothetical protein
LVLVAEVFPLVVAGDFEVEPVVGPGVWLPLEGLLVVWSSDGVSVSVGSAFEVEVPCADADKANREMARMVLIEKGECPREILIFEID